MSAMIKSPVQPLPEFRAYPVNIPGSIFPPNWWRRLFSLVEIGEKKHFSKKKIIAVERICQIFVHEVTFCLSVVVFSFFVSRITEAFHCFAPPLLCRTRPNQKCRGAFFDPANCVFGNSLVSVEYWVDLSWFQHNSSKARIRPRELSVWIILGFLIWRHEQFANVHRCLRSFLFCWNKDPVPRQRNGAANDIRPDNDMIRRESTSFFVDDAQGFLSSRRFLHKARFFFLSLLTSHSRSVGKCARKKRCLPVGFLVIGLLHLFAIEGRSVDSSWEHTSYHHEFLLGAPTSCSTTTLCESGTHQRDVLWKEEATLESYATGLSPVHRHLGNANRSPDACLRSGIGYARLFWKCHNWHMVVRVAPSHIFQSLITDGDSHPFHS